MTSNKKIPKLKIVFQFSADLSKIRKKFSQSKLNALIDWLTIHIVVVFSAEKVDLCWWSQERHFSDWVPFPKCHFEARNNRINKRRLQQGLILMTLITGIIGFNCCHIQVFTWKVLCSGAMAERTGWLSYTAVHISLAFGLFNLWNVHFLKSVATI